MTMTEITGPRRVRQEDDAEDNDGVREGRSAIVMIGDNTETGERRKRRREGEIDTKISEGGEDDRRRKGELGSRMSDNLKRKVREMKNQGVGMFNKHKNDNGTRRVKELVLGFETLGGPGVNLEVKNHESRFKESIKKSYLSPEKRRTFCPDPSTSPRHTARLRKLGTWPPG